MKWDKRYLFIGILFLILAVNCVAFLIHKDFSTYYVSGLVIFTFLGIAFIRRAKN